jgi:hypothetical protein
MPDIKLGDKARVKTRDEWPSPPGYPLGGCTGTVVKVWDPDNAVLSQFLEVRIDKAVGEFREGTALTFHVEDLGKL